MRGGKGREGMDKVAVRAETGSEKRGEIEVMVEVWWGKCLKCFDFFLIFKGAA